MVGEGNTKSDSLSRLKIASQLAIFYAPLSLQDIVNNVNYKQSKCLGIEQVSPSIHDRLNFLSPATLPVIPTQTVNHRIATQISFNTPFRQPLPIAHLAPCNAIPMHDVPTQQPLLGKPHLLRHTHRRPVLTRTLPLRPPQSQSILPHWIERVLE